MKRKLLIGLLLISLLIPMVGGAFPVAAKNAKTDYDFKGIYLTRSSIDLKTEGSATLSVRRIGVSRGRKLQWHSWDPAIATVSETGEVTAVAPGSTKITVSAGEYSASCIVNVFENDPVYDKYNHTMELLQDFYDLRFGMFLHFNSSTYEFAQIGGDWAGEQRESRFSPRSWDPSQLNCRDWAKAAKSAGMRFAVLTTKHHDGFDIWDSKYTDYDVGSATNKTDVVKEFVEGCRAEGIQPALYFSMLDIKHKITSSSCNDTDIEFIKAQLTELLTNYGEIPFIIFDAWNAYWGGPNYDLLPYDEIVNLVHTLQPNCLVINISCEANNVHSEVAMFESAAGQNVPDWFRNVNISCNTVSKHWFWCDSYNSDTFKDVDWVLNQNVNPFAESDTVFILNVAPNQKGAIIQKYKTLLANIGKGYEKPADSVSLPEEWAADYDYRQNLLFRKPATQASRDGNATAERAVDGYTDYEFNHETTSRTAGNGSWWSADIGYVTDFGKLTIYAGEKGTEKLLRNGCLIFSDKPFGKMEYSTLSKKEGVTCLPLKDAEEFKDTLTLDLTGSKGRYVGIILKTGGNLTLTEVVLNPAGVSDNRIVGLRTTLSRLSVSSDTAFDQLPLPGEAQFVTADGSLKVLPLNWSNEGYDPSYVGSLQLTAHPEGSDYTVTLPMTVIEGNRFKLHTPKSVKASSIWSADSDWAAVKNVISDTGMVIDSSNILYSTHDNAYNATSMWHSADGVTKANLTFTFQEAVNLSHLLIWNHNQQNLTDRGVKEMEVFYTNVDNPGERDWQSAGTFTLHKASDSPTQAATDLLMLGNITAKQIKLDLKQNFGSSSHIGLSQVFFMECKSGMSELASAVSQFELLSRFDYPAEDYEAAKSVYLNAVKALESGKNNASVAKSLLSQIDHLGSVMTPQKLSGLNSLTLKINAGEQLPETIEIKVGGKAEAVAVIWEKISEDRLTHSGAFTLRGRIDGAPCPVTVAVSVVDKSSAALQSLVKSYGEINTAVYTTESVDLFTKALSDAQTVLEREEATQLEIDSAKFALKSAKYGLTLPIYASLSLKEEPPRVETPGESTPGQSDPSVNESPDYSPIKPNAEDPKGLSAGAITAIVLGAIAVIGAVGVAIGLTRKKK